MAIIAKWVSPTTVILKLAVLSFPGGAPKISCCIMVF